MKEADKTQLTIIVDQELWRQLLAQGVVTLHEGEELSFDLDVLSFAIRRNAGPDAIEIVRAYRMEDVDHSAPAEAAPPSLRVVASN